MPQHLRERAAEMAQPLREIASEIAAKPPPRRAQGLLAPSLRFVFDWPFRAVLTLVLALRITANQLTMLSLGAYLTVAGMLAAGWRFLPGMLLIPASLLDIFDGAVARARGESGRHGALLDSVVDRAADAAVLAALFVSLAGQGLGTDAALALGAMGVSLAVSFSRAQAQALGAPMGEGLFARAERSVALMVGLTLPDALPWALGALVALGAVTLVQRVMIARRHLGGESGHAQ